MIRCELDCFVLRKYSHGVCGEPNRMSPFIRVRRVRLQRFDRRKGFTVIEIVVTAVVLAVLAALLIPAVQAVRESSRQLTCKNHQRQLTTAALTYHEDYGALPPPSLSGGGAITALFPRLEQRPAEECIASGVTSVEVLECPSDGEIAGRLRPQSYLVNSSPGWNSGFTAEGPFYAPRGGRRTLRDITDGTAHTACVSETLAWRVGGTVRDAEAQPIRYSWQVIVPFLTGDPSNSNQLAAVREQTELSISDCQSELRQYVPGNESGVHFHSWGANAWGSYSHWLPPNLPRCMPSGGSSPNAFLLFNNGARSMHPGGVVVCLLDGRSVLMAESIDRAVWRAIGTSNGGETETLRQ